MNKQVENLTGQLKEIAEIVNAFEYEAVQLTIIDRLVPHMIEWNKKNIKNKSAESTEESANNTPRVKRKPGATRILNEMVLTDFFTLPRKIAEITAHISATYQQDFLTSQLSGTLLGLVNGRVLSRVTGREDSRYKYLLSEKQPDDSSKGC